MTNPLSQASCVILRVAPLLPVAVGLIGGVVCDCCFPLGAPWTVVYFIAFAATSLIAILRPVRRNYGAWLVLAAAWCAGAVLHLSSARTISPSSIERYVIGSPSPDRIARLRGRVISQPRILGVPENPFARWSYGSQRTAFLLEVESAEGQRGDVVVTGRIRVTVGEAVLDLRENERVEVFGRLYRFRPPMNPGSFDWAALYRRQGVVAGMRCDHWENVRRLDSSPPLGDASLLDWFRTTVRGLLTDDLATGGDEERSLLEAMVLGHRSQLDRRLNEVFIQAGCVHFLAVSGIHVAIMLFFAWAVGRALMLQPRTCTWVMLAAVILYAAVAEPRPPILRASVVAVLYCIARLLPRPRAALNWLSAAAIVLILLEPATIFDAGFQLSFAAVLGVVHLSPALSEAGRGLRLTFARVILRRPFEDMDRQLADRASRTSDGWPFFAWGARRLAWRLTVFPLSIAVGAWLAGCPIVAAHFHRLHPWGPINSVIVLPVVSLVMALGFVKIIAVGMFPSLGAWVGGVLGVLDAWLIRVVEWLASFPGASISLPPPPWWVFVPFYVLLVLFAWRFRVPPRMPQEDWCPRPHQVSLPPRWLGRTCAAAGIVCAIGIAAWRWPAAPQRLTITFLSVGRASAMVLELPDGKTVVYDAGSAGPYDVGRHTVVPFLRHRGITRIDRVYVSHANLDHFSGVPTILAEVPTGPVTVNRYLEARSPPGSPSRHFLDLLAGRGHPIETLDPSMERWNIGGVTFEYLWPPDGLGEDVPTNDTSTILRLSYAGHSILLTGDIDERAQRGLMDSGELGADVLALPHHGAVRSTTSSFIRAVGPSVVIRSGGEPMAETYSGLQQVIGAIPLYNTADVGAVQVRIDAGGFRISTMRTGATALSRSPG